MKKLLVFLIGSLFFCSASYAVVSSLTLCENDPSVGVIVINSIKSTIFGLTKTCDEVNVDKFCEPFSVAGNYFCKIFAVNQISNNMGQEVIRIAGNQIFVINSRTSDYYILQRDGKFYVVHY